MPVLQADGRSPRVNHFRIPKTGRSPRSRAKGPMQILPRRNRRSHRDLDRTPRSMCGNSGHRTIRRGTPKSPAKYASHLPARRLLEAQRRIRLRENLRLHHSVPQGPPRPHTRARPGDHEDPAFCKRSHEGARFLQAPAGGCEPPPRTNSRARDSTKPRVHGKTTLPIRYWRCASPWANSSQHRLWKNWHVSLVLRAEQIGPRFVAISIRRCNIPQPCYAPRAPTLRSMESNTT